MASSSSVLIPGTSVVATVLSSTPSSTVLVPASAAVLPALPTPPGPPPMSASAAILPALPTLTTPSVPAPPTVPAVAQTPASVLTTSTASLAAGFGVSMPAYAVGDVSVVEPTLGATPSVGRYIQAGWSSFSALTYMYTQYCYARIYTVMLVQWCIVCTCEDQVFGGTWRWNYYKYVHVCVRLAEKPGTCI